MVKSKEEFLKNILKSNDLKATNSRMDLLSVLFDAKKPMTLKEIMLKMGDGGAHEVTMYRMLSSFKDLGLVKQLDFQDTVPYFELVDHDHDHHHIVCTSCKKVSDFVGCGSEVLVKKALAQASDFSSINSHSFEFFGLCNKCDKK